jgi:hypothetical protein
LAALSVYSIAKPKRPGNFAKETNVAGILQKLREIALKLVISSNEVEYRLASLEGWP